MTENTKDLSKFGNRELSILSDLLKAYANGKYASENDTLNEDISYEFNPNSGEVFLVDGDYNVAMLSEDKYGNTVLENWLNCSNCGKEDLRSEITLDEDGNCSECKGK